jgi:hypothetical protein
MSDNTVNHRWGRAFKSVAELKSAIMEYLEKHNIRPKEKRT